MTARTIAGLALLPFFTGCISFNYIRYSGGEPVPDTALEGLQPKRSDFAECLHQLGAPDLVWPSENGNIQVAYAWIDASDWGLSFSWALEQFISARISLDSVDYEIESVVLAFDHDLQLDHISRGFLWDLAPSAQPSTAASRMLRDAPR